MTQLRQLAAQDRDGWERLYRGYAHFYQVETDAGKLDTLFGWLLDPAHVCEGLVALDDESRLIGLAHYRAMPSPLRGAGSDSLTICLLIQPSVAVVPPRACFAISMTLPCRRGGRSCAGSRGTTITGQEAFMTGLPCGLTGSPMK